MVLLSIFFPAFGLLLYYNTQAALGNTHAYTHAYTHTQTHTHIHAYTWWAAHQAVAPLVAPGENELAT